MYLSDTSLIVRGYRDRIQRGGGSVVVNTSGGIDIKGGATQQISIGGNSNPIVLVNSTTISATLTVSGIGTHTFSGPINIATGVGQFSPLLVNTAETNSVNLFTANRSGNRRFIQQMALTSDDILFYSVTGAGSGTATEALRIVNATGWVSIPTRLGLGTATPIAALDVAGNARMTGTTTTGLLVAAASSASASIAVLTQNAATATAPVLVVKLGATPGAGGDAMQVQDSSGVVLLQIGGTGNPTFHGSGGNAGAVLFVRGRSSAPGATGAGIAGLWYDDTAKAFKFIDSAGVVKTITAA